MKSMNLTKIAGTLAALATGTSAYAQDSDKGTVANLTLKLTEYLTDPGLLLKDENGKVLPEKIPTFENQYDVESASKYVSTNEYGSKITTYKISNKEFLEGLRDEVGLIPDIMGWALVMVENDGENTVFIQKKDEEPINVSSYLYFESEDAGAEQESSKYEYTETEDSSSTKATGSFKGKYLVSVKGEFPSTSIDLQGVYDESAILKTFGSGEDQYTQWIPGARSVTSISGSLDFEDEDIEDEDIEDEDIEDEDDEDEDDEDDESVVTGSISIAAGKPVDLGLYSND